MDLYYIMTPSTTYWWLWKLLYHSLHPCIFLPESHHVCTQGSWQTYWDCTDIHAVFVPSLERESTKSINTYMYVALFHNSPCSIQEELGDWLVNSYLSDSFLVLFLFSKEKRTKFSTRISLCLQHKAGGDTTLYIFQSNTYLLHFPLAALVPGSLVSPPLCS